MHFGANFCVAKFKSIKKAFQPCAKHIGPQQFLGSFRPTKSKFLIFQLFLAVAVFLVYKSHFEPIEH